MRAVDAEVFPGQQIPGPGHVDRGVEQLDHDIVLNHSVAVFAEDRVVPNRVIDRQADEPAEQQVVGDLFDELPLAANAEEHLQQHCTHQLLRRDARAATLDVGFVHRREALVHLGKRFVHPQADRPQRVIRWNKVLQPHCRKQTLVVNVIASHRRTSI